jgi:hypothetical protein
MSFGADEVLDLLEAGPETAADIARLRLVRPGDVDQALVHLLKAGRVVWDAPPAGSLDEAWMPRYRLSDGVAAHRARLHGRTVGGS